MRTTAIFLSVLTIFLPASASLPCSTAAISSLLPAEAKVNYVIPVVANGTFGDASTNLEFPVNATGLPELCAVSINVISSGSSSYNFGMFLPAQWNGRTMTAGNGGFAGGINWPDMGTFSQYGFAGIATDTGHSAGAGDLSWGLNKPESLIDWGYRAMHGSVSLGKQVIQAYYENDVAFSYYASCSTGGRQGLKELQMFPEDFDGVLAGAPAWWTTHLQTWTVQVALHNLPVNGSNYISPALFEGVILPEIMRQCDPQDGISDGIIQDPYRCSFMPETLTCKSSSNTSACLTAPQLDTLYHIYNDYVDTNQTFVFPHLALGADASILTGNTNGGPSTLGTGFVQNAVYNNTNWSFLDFDYQVVEDADRINPGQADANQFDISAFQSKGGKLMMYHGLADPLISTGSSLYYYKHTLTSMAQYNVDLDSFYRLFLIPGMGHCTGSSNIPARNAPWYIAAGGQDVTGASHSVPGFEDAQHDAILALMEWVEKGHAPNYLIATKFVNDTVAEGVELQRPLCPYPQQAKYVGGDVDQASSWECQSLY